MPDRGRRVHQTAVGSGALVEELRGGLGRQRDRWTRLVRAVMVVQAGALVVVVACGVLPLLAGASTTTVFGIRIGPGFAVLGAATGVAVLAGWRWPAAVLRRVAFWAAVSWTALFVACGTYYPDPGGAWETNPGSAITTAGLALAFFSEFVLLNAESFDMEPSPVP